MAQVIKVKNVRAGGTFPFAAVETVIAIEPYRLDGYFFPRRIHFNIEDWESGCEAQSTPFTDYSIMNTYDY